MKVQFIKSPTGAFKLAYDAGMIGEIPDELAAKLIDNGFAVKVQEKKRVTKAEASEKRGKVPSNNSGGKRAGKSKRS